MRKIRKTFWDFTRAHEPITDAEKFEAMARNHLNRDWDYLLKFWTHIPISYRVG